MKAHLERVIAEHDRRYEQRFTDQRDAVMKAELATEKRFEGVNEFRAQLADQARELMPRSETEALLRVLSEKVASLADAAHQSAGSRRGADQVVGYVFGAVGLLVGVVAAVIAVATR